MAATVEKHRFADYVCVPNEDGCQALRMYEQGFSTYQIARAFGVQRTTLMRFMKRAGVVLRNVPHGKKNDTARTLPEKRRTSMHQVQNCPAVD